MHWPMGTRITHPPRVGVEYESRTTLKTGHFRQRKEYQNLSGLKIAHRNATTSEYSKWSFIR